MAKVLFDMDGTLFDYNSGLYKGLLKMFPPDLLPLLYANKSHVSDLEEHAWIKEMIRVIKREPNWWRDLEFFSLGCDIYRACKKFDMDISILTKSPWSNSDAAAQKLECIWKHFGKETQVNLVTETKHQVHGDVLVEDWVDYLEPWLDAHPEGHGILIAHTYNEDFEHERVVRYDGKNQEEVVNLLERVKDVA